MDKHMSDFEFLQNPVSKKFVILAPRRSKRTNVKEASAVCPFCPGREGEEGELYRYPSKDVILASDKGARPESQKVSDSAVALPGTVWNPASLPRMTDDSWRVRVIPNKFPFTEHHEIVIHSPDHHKNFDELPFEQVDLIFQTYRQRFNFHTQQAGRQVYIFHNRGHAAGESLPHPHTQIAIVPDNVRLDIPPLDMGIYKNESGIRNQESWFNSIIHNSLFMIQKHKNVEGGGLQDVLETDSFYIFCPQTSEWPDEVWVAPKKQNGTFGSITDAAITDIAFLVSRLIQIFDLRHGYEFPFNFYIAPGRNWYLRLIPRLKILGGFELGTQIMVNTQDPKETFAFINEHFWQPDPEKIKGEHQAEYLKSV